MPIDIKYIKGAIKRLNDFFYPYMVDGKEWNIDEIMDNYLAAGGDRTDPIPTFGSPKETRYDTKKRRNEYERR